MGTTQLNNSEFDESFTEKSVHFDSMAEQTTSKQDAKSEDGSEQGIYLLISHGGRMHDPRGGRRIVSFMEGHIELIHTKDLTIELREEMCTMVLLAFGNLDMDLISCIIQKKNLIANAVMVLNLIRRQNFIVNQDTMENLIVILMVLMANAIMVLVESDSEAEFHRKPRHHEKPNRHSHGFGPVNVEIDLEVVPVVNLRLMIIFICPFMILGSVDMGFEVVLTIDLKLKNLIIFLGNILMDSVLVENLGLNKMKSHSIMENLEIVNARFEVREDVKEFPHKHRHHGGPPSFRTYEHGRRNKYEHGPRGRFEKELKNHSDHSENYGHENRLRGHRFEHSRHGSGSDYSSKSFRHHRGDQKEEKDDESKDEDNEGKNRDDEGKEDNEGKNGDDKGEEEENGESREYYIIAGDK
ncbi:3321_t:CDS:2, partial [Acaulospora colombiana]